MAHTRIAQDCWVPSTTTVAPGYYGGAANQRFTLASISSVVACTSSYAWLWPKGNSRLNYIPVGEGCPRCLVKQTSCWSGIHGAVSDKRGEEDGSGSGSIVPYAKIFVDASTCILCKRIRDQVLILSTGWGKRKQKKQKKNYEKNVASAKGKFSLLLLILFLFSIFFLLFSYFKFLNLC